jgi:hypothetical protein
MAALTSARVVVVAQARAGGVVAKCSAARVGGVQAKAPASVRLGGTSRTHTYAHTGIACLCASNSVYTGAARRTLGDVTAASRVQWGRTAGAYWDGMEKNVTGGETRHWNPTEPYIFFPVLSRFYQAAGKPGVWSARPRDWTSRSWRRRRLTRRTSTRTRKRSGPRPWYVGVGIPE